MAGLQHATPGNTISGRVLDANGRVPVNVALCAWVSTGPGSSSCAPIPILPDGSFKSPPLRPAVYALAVGPSPGLSTAADVDGGLAIVAVRAQDISGIRITTRRYSLRGKYVMRGDNPRAKWPSYLHVTARLVAPAGVPSIADGSRGAPNGEFVLHNVFGKRVLRAGYAFDGPDRWWPDRVLLDGTDVTDVPTDFSEHPDAKLEFVFTQHPARVVGTVRLSDVRPPSVRPW